MQCPNCHIELDITELVPLDPRQYETLTAVREIARNDIRGTASTTAIAVRVGYTTRWAREWLKTLEQLGLVHRPYGKKSGWKAINHQHALVQLRVLQPAA